MPAPIALFIYKRPVHTLNTLKALANNPLAKDTELYVFCDGPKPNATEDDLAAIRETRDVIRSQQWCGKVNMIESAVNKGLARNIIDGITMILKNHETVIVLEDDTQPAVGFLDYMNKALETYQDEPKVMMVSGFMWPVPKDGLPETFFYNVNSFWGWATYARSWKFFIEDTATILFMLQGRHDREILLFNGGRGISYNNQLNENMAGTLNTWGVKWHATMFLMDGYVLHPRHSLVRNIGFDGTGENCGVEEGYDVDFDINQTINVVKQPLVRNEVIYERVKVFFDAIPGLHHPPYVHPPIHIRAVNKGIRIMKRVLGIKPAKK